MDIQITTKSGQKYLLKGEELVEGFERHIINTTGRTVSSHEKKQFLRDFLSTFEKEPEKKPCGLCGNIGDDGRCYE